MDFSMAGYNASSTPCCPNIAATHTRVTVKPKGRHGDFDAIQSAIKAVSNMPLQGQFRGMVVLEKGIYSIQNNETISIEKSGVVLHGMPGAVLLASPPPGCCNNQDLPECKDLHPPCYRTNPMIRIGAAKRPYFTAVGHMKMPVKQPYVPSGATELFLDAPDQQSQQALQLLVGKLVLVHKLNSERWTEAMRYAPPPSDPTQNGKCKTRKPKPDPGAWLTACTLRPPGGLEGCRGVHWLRRVTTVNLQAQTVVLDAPISDSINASLAYGLLVPVNGGYDVQHVGVEGIIGNYTLARCHQIQAQNTSWNYTKQCYTVNTFISTTENMEHAWVRDVTSIDASSVVGFAGRFLTALRAKAFSTAVQWRGGAEPGILGITGTASHVLFDSYHCDVPDAVCVSTGGAVGPNVIRNSWGASPIQPHMNWATGLLLENISGPSPQIINRCCMGSSHGWAAGYSVVWQGNYTGNLALAKPPNGTNWVIGTNGKQVVSNVPKGCRNESIGEVQHVLSLKGSLFEAQLRERLANSAAQHGVLPPSKERVG